MEASRLLAALSLILYDFEQGGIRAGLEELNQIAQRAVAEPAEATHQDTLAQTIAKLGDILKTARSRSAPLSLNAALKDVGAHSIAAAQLSAELDAIVSAKPFLLQRAAKSIARWHKGVTDKYAGVKAAAESLVRLGISEPAFEGEMYEAGILMPSAFTQNDLRRVNNHITEWLRHLDTIDEITRGSTRDKVPITSVSTGSFDVFLSLDPEGAYALLILAAGVVAIMRSCRDAQESREALQNKGYPTTVLDPMKAHEATLLEQGKVEVENKILERRAKAIDDSRMNELRGWLRRAIDYVLNCMNRGVDVEVSTPPGTREQTDEVNETIQAMRAEIAGLQRKLLEATRELPDRSTPLLALPDPNDGSASAGSDPSDDGEPGSKEQTA